MLDRERQNLVGILQQRFGVRANAPADQPGIAQRKRQAVRVGEPARLRQRRVTSGQCSIEISERDQQLR